MRRGQLSYRRDFAIVYRRSRLAGLEISHINETEGARPPSRVSAQIIKKLPYRRQTRLFEVFVISDTFLQDNIQLSAAYSKICLAEYDFGLRNKMDELMDHSPIRQTSELGKFISTAGKSIINLVKLGSLFEKYRKMWKIQSCEVCEFCILLYYARKTVTTFSKLRVSSLSQMFETGQLKIV